MGCCNPKSNGKVRSLEANKKFLVEMSEYPYLSMNEIAILTILFQDLTSNYKTGTRFEKSEFLFFIKAPGLISEKIFELFNPSSQNSLKLTDFLKGIESFCKSPEKNQFYLFFQLFSLESNDKITEIDLNLAFHHILRILFKNEKNSIYLPEDPINLIKKSKSGKEFSHKILQIYSTNKDYLTFEDFCKFLTDFSQIPDAIHNFFSFSSWQDLGNNSSGLNSANNDFFFDKVKKFDNDSELFAVLRCNLLIFYSDSLLSSIIELVYLPEALIRIKNLSINIYCYSKKQIKINFCVDNYNKLLEWKKYLKTQLGIKNFSDFYELKEIIGTGMHSNVFRAVNKINGISYAAKVMKKSNTEKLDKKMIFSEVNILNVLKHKNIVRIKEFIETENCYYIVEELIQGQCLQNLVRVLKEFEIKCVMKCILHALNYLHSIGIIHRDVKMENMIVCGNSEFINVKLIDFDLADFMLPNKKFNQYCGTVAYMAPEVHLNENYNEKIDIWSAGVVAYTLVAKRFPFNGINEKEMASRALDLTPDYSRFSLQAKNFTEQMLNKDPSLRPCAKHALEHEWLNFDHNLKEKISTIESLKIDGNSDTLNFQSKNLNSHKN